MSTGSEVFPDIHRVLRQAFPGLRFHVKSGSYHYDSRGVYRVNTSACVEYDREGVLAAGGNERVMRDLVKPVLQAAGGSVQSVSFEQYIPRKIHEARKRDDKAEQMVEELMPLIEAGASRDAIKNAILGLIR